MDTIDSVNEVDEADVNITATVLDLLIEGYKGQRTTLTKQIAALEAQRRVIEAMLNRLVKLTEP